MLHANGYYGHAVLWLLGNYKNVKHVHHLRSLILQQFLCVKHDQNDKKR